MTPRALLERLRAWQPVAYLVARGIVYGSTFALGAVAAWYGDDARPEWLDRSLAVAAFVAGPLALVNLSRPTRTPQP